MQNLLTCPEAEILKGVSTARVVTKEAIRINSLFSSTLPLLERFMSRAARVQQLSEKTLRLRLTS